MMTFRPVRHQKIQARRTRSPAEGAQLQVEPRSIHLIGPLRLEPGDHRVDLGIAELVLPRRQLALSRRTDVLDDLAQRGGGVLQFVAAAVEGGQRIKPVGVFPPPVGCNLAVIAVTGRAMFLVHLGAQRHLPRVRLARDVAPREGLHALLVAVAGLPIACTDEHYRHRDDGALPSFTTHGALFNRMKAPSYSTVPLKTPSVSGACPSPSSCGAEGDVAAGGASWACPSPLLCGWEWPGPSGCGSDITPSP